MTKTRFGIGRRAQIPPPRYHSGRDDNKEEWSGGLRNKVYFFTELKFGDPDVAVSQLLRMTRKKITLLRMTRKGGYGYFTVDAGI